MRIITDPSFQLQHIFFSIVREFFHYHHFQVKLSSLRRWGANVILKSCYWWCDKLSNKLLKMSFTVWSISCSIGQYIRIAKGCQWGIVFNDLTNYPTNYPTNSWKCHLLCCLYFDWPDNIKGLREAVSGVLYLMIWQIIQQIPENVIYCVVYILICIAIYKDCKRLISGVLYSMISQIIQQFPENVIDFVVYYLIRRAIYNDCKRLLVGYCIWWFDILSNEFLKSLFTS